MADITRGSTLDFGLRYLRDHGLSVVPCIHRKKSPCIPSWVNYQYHCPSLRAIEDWFSGENADRNIAIVTGTVSNLLVLDIDPKNGGDKTIEGLEIPRTPTVRTGGGGWHYYFDLPRGLGKIRNFVGLMPGVDIRADGGIVVAPPSVHESGRAYEWTVGPWECPFAPVPDWLLKRIKSRMEGTPASRKDPEGKGGAEAKGRNKRGWLKDVIFGVDQGLRNEAAAKLAGLFLQHRFEGDDLAAIMDLWNAQNKPPLDAKELTTVIESISKKEALGDAESDEPDIPGKMNFRISELTKVDMGAASIYHVRIWGRTIRMSPHDLIKFEQFKTAVMAATDNVPWIKSPRTAWPDYLHRIMHSGRFKRIEAPEVSSEFENQKALIREHLSSAASKDPKKLLAKNGVFEDGKHYYFVLGSLHENMGKASQRIGLNLLTDMLKKSLGAKFVSKRVQIPDDEDKIVKRWRVEKSALNPSDKHEEEDNTMDWGSSESSVVNAEAANDLQSNQQVSQDGSGTLP
jgi:hypothetical protein